MLKKTIFVLICLSLMVSGLVTAQSNENTLVIATTTEPNTLDVHRATSGGLARFWGATLVAKHPDTSEYVPYLAESWSASDDGLTWEFNLREDVIFHDGTPFTAQSYVYTFERWFADETASPTASTYALIESVEAVDDYTLRLNLAAPFYPLLELLTQGFAQPISQSAVEAAGDNYGQQPVGVGAFRVVEWVVGDRLVMEANPDYAWAPAFLSGGAPQVERVIIRFIPEYTTILAGLESGEIDLLFGTAVNARDVGGLIERGFDFFESYTPGMIPYVAMNVSTSPFDDLLVRQAVNYAIDKDAFVAILGGTAIPQYGPISISVAGYWEGIEEVGYRFDAERARALLEEAGYSFNSDGIAEKDGETLSLNLLLIPDFAFFGQVLQAMMAEVGIALEIEQTDVGVLYGRAFAGDYQIAMGGYDFGEADVLYTFYHSVNIGGLNVSQLNDPVLDEILDRTRNEIDPIARQEAVNQAQAYIMEQAIVAPIITLIDFFPISPRVNGLVISRDVTLWLSDVTLD